MKRPSTKSLSFGAKPASEEQTDQPIEEWLRFLMANDSKFRGAIINVLIEHAMSLDERRQQRTATTWPDESDIYTGTIVRLRTLFKRQLQAEGWTPPAKKRR